MRPLCLKQRNERKLSVPRIALAAAIAAVSYQNPALAQGRDASLVLEEIIVSAQKELENIQDIPSTVNAVGADSIDEYKVFSIDDISTLASGLSFDRPDARRQTITIRGITSDPDNVALPPISTYFNDQPVRAQEAFQAFYDISLIEILRGPQGTLQGRTDPAGAIHIYSQRPNTSEIDGYVQQSFSDNSGSNTQFGVSLPVIPNVLAVRLAGVYDDNEGQEIQNITTGQDEHQRTRSGRITIDWLPTDEIDASMTYQYNELASGVPQTVEGDVGGLIDSMNFATAAAGGLIAAIQADPTLAGVVSPVALGQSVFSYRGKVPTHLQGLNIKAGDRKAIHGGIHDNNFRNEFINLRLEFDLGDYSLSSITGYKELVSDNTLDRDDGWVYRTLPQLQRTLSKIRVRSEELRLAYTEGDFWEYQVGLFYEESSSRTINDVDASGGFDLTGAIAGLQTWDAINSLNIPLDRKNTAIFMHNTFNFTDQTTMQVGIRWQKAEYDSKATSSPRNNYVAPADDPTVPWNPAAGDGSGGPGEWAACGGNAICNATYAGTLAALNANFGNQAAFNAFFSQLVNGELIPENLQSDDATAVTGGIKLQHYLGATSHETMVYASLDRSFRPAGVTITPSPLVGDILVFDEETSNSLELGFKSTLMEGSLRINGAAYVQQYDGYQARADVVNFINSLGATEEVQGGITFNADATITGAELEFQKVLTPTWNIGGGMAYIDGTFDSGAEGPCNGPVATGEQVATCDIGGQDVSSAPLWSGTFNTEYFIPMETMQGSEWYVRGVLSYKGEQDNRLVEGLAISDYTIINVFTGLRSDAGEWDLSLWAKNIADTERRADLKNVYEVSFGATNFRRSTMIAPRLVGLTFRYNFNS